MPIDVKNLKSMDEILEAKQALDARAEELKLAEAQSLHDSLMGVLERMSRIDAVPNKLKEALSDAEGNFAPHKFIKRPR